VRRHTVILPVGHPVLDRADEQVAHRGVGHPRRGEELPVWTPASANKINPRGSGCRRVRAPTRTTRRYYAPVLVYVCLRNGCVSRVSVSVVCAGRTTAYRVSRGTPKASARRSG
jgi:hypothetical protein